MGRRESIELTAICCIYRDGEVLLQNRVKKEWQGYALPGGHVEPGESIVESIIREIREETGLTIYHPKLCGIKQFPIEDGRYLVFLFRANEFEGELISSDEGKMEWVRMNELDQYNTVSDLKEHLDVTFREDLTEFQYIVNGDDWIVKLY